MKLSDHFYLNEFEKSQTALRRGIVNRVPSELIHRLENLCQKVLEPARAAAGGRSMVVGSGYRCPKLNASVGGAESSQHVLAEAADVEMPGVSNYDLAYFIMRNGVFDQLILEFYTPGQPSSGWVHVSFTERYVLRHEVLTKQPGEPYVAGLIP